MLFHLCCLIPSLLNSRTLAPTEHDRQSRTRLWEGKHNETREGNHDETTDGLTAVASGLALVWSSSAVCGVPAGAQEDSAWPAISYGPAGQQTNLPLLQGTITQSGTPARADSHTLGVAAQSPGGALKVSGSKTISSGAGGTKSISGIRAVFNKYNYREYHSGCAGDMTYSYRPESTHALAHYTPTANKKSYSTCTTYAKGDSWWKQNGTNYTQSGGLNFKGLGLNVQGGWHSNTRLLFAFNGKGKLCGSTSAGWATAPLAVGDNA